MRNVEEIKKELKKLRDLKIQRDADEEMMVFIRSLAESVGAVDYSRVRVQGGDHGASIENKVERLEAMYAKISKEREQLCDLEERALNIISVLPAGRENALLIRRYCLGETWEAIAKRMGCSVRNTGLIHGKALLMLADKMQQHSKDSVR